FLALQAQTIETVVDDGCKGWDLAQEALRELILEFKHRKQPLPPALDGYDFSLTAQTIRAPLSGPKPYKTFFRDIGISIVVGEVSQQFGLKPHRNVSKHAAPRPSACSIVATAWTEFRLSLETAERETAQRPPTERAIQKIWQKYGPLIRPI